MNKTTCRSLQLTCLVLLAALLLTGTAGARSPTDNTEIEIGDVLFQGEQNLNFSAFLKGGAMPDFFATPDGTQTISLSGGKGSISMNQQTGLYYAYYSGTADPTKNIRIMNLAASLGNLRIDIASSAPDGANAAENAAEVRELVNDIGICYYFSGGAADIAGIHQPWYTYTITYGDGAQSTRVTNINGVVVELNSNNNPSTKDTNIAFKYKDNTNTGSAVITFKTNLNGLTYTASASHTLIPSPAFAITPAKSVMTAGETTTLTLKGQPYENYNLKITPVDGTNGVYFPQTVSGWVHYQEINAYPNWNGTKIISITAGSHINQTYYTINASKGGEIRTTVITVEKLTRTLTLTAPGDTAAGLFASGDTMKLTCGISSPQPGDMGSLYLSGANMAEQLVTTLDLSGSAKEYFISTRGLDAGTYSLTLRSSDGKTPEKTISFYLSEPSIHLTIEGGDYATLVQGAELNLSWRARGSPGVQSATDTTGEVRWYIFGTNFHLAGHSLFPITNSSIGTAAPQGQAKAAYDKTLTEGLDTGTYTIIIEHPGADNTFTLSADAYNTAFSSVTTAWGDTIAVGGMQTSNAVYTVESLLKHSQSDDLYVLTEFSVEKPWLAATDISDAVIGNTIKISGETNYPAGKAVSLTIRPISFDVGTNANTAMKIAVPADVTTSGDSVYNKRTFNFSSITTDTWYPGTYAAKISLSEYNASLEMTFIVGVDGRVSSADLTAPLTYSGAYETTSTPAQTTAGPAETAQPMETIPLSSSAATATAAPAETKSPVPIAGILAGAFAAAAYFRRH